MAYSSIGLMYLGSGKNKSFCNYSGSKFLGSRFKVKLIKEGFESETNAEFIRFLRYARQSYTKVQIEPYVTLDTPNREL